MFDVAEAACCTDISVRPLSVICAGLLATPSVSCCSVGVPTLDSGSVAPLITGTSSPTVAVVNAKNTIETNVSTSGTRLSCTRRNFANCALRRDSRIARAREVAGISHPPGGGGDLRGPLTIGERDAAEARRFDAFHHV